MEWISVAEHRLTEELDLLSDARSSSYKSGNRSRKSATSSIISARAKEKNRLAELRAKRKMLERKQALQAADEASRLETEIAKAQASESVYACLEAENQGNLENKDDTVPGVTQSQPNFMSSTPAAPLDRVALVFNPNSLVSKNPPHANRSFTGGPPRMVTVSDIPTRRERHAKSFEGVMAMQRQQNE